MSSNKQWLVILHSCYMVNRAIISAVGVFTTKRFQGGNFPLDYTGEHIGKNEAYKRENLQVEKYHNFISVSHSFAYINII